MKRRTLYILLACEALVCIGLFMGRSMLPGLYSQALAFPFWQIAQGLRVLSLSGRLGNALALFLLVAVSLVPLLPVRKGARGWEDALLPVLTLGMMVSLILMQIRPSLRASWERSSPHMWRRLWGLRSGLYSPPGRSSARFDISERARGISLSPRRGRCSCSSARD